MLIQKGKHVRLKSNPEQTGILIGEEKTIGSRLFVKVEFSNGLVKSQPLSLLEEVKPGTYENLVDQLSNGRFVESKWLRRTITQLRVTESLNEIVYSMEATNTDFYAYQFKPVLKMMNSPTDALLIADEVGLGKTIEAGLIWTELRARFQFNRLLIVCPRTLCQKWQDELTHRFGVHAEIVNTQKLLDTLSAVRFQGDTRGFAYVCSMQGLRPYRGWDNQETNREDTYGKTQNDLARFLDEASYGNQLLDLLVVDEAHHMRNPDTQVHKLGRLLNEVSTHRLFLSATPIHLRNRDLHSLLSMVDPDTFEFESTLEDLIETNAPIVEARDLLQSADSSIDHIFNLIDDASGYEVLRESKALEQIQQELMKNDLDNAKRADLAARLDRVNQLANYVNRTRRRDVEEFRVIRDPKTPVLEMNLKERHFYDQISEVVRSYALQRRSNQLFLLSTPQRLLTSSFAAASAYWCNSNSLTDDHEIEESDIDLEESSIDDKPLRKLISKKARELNMTTSLEKTDTKYNLFIRQMQMLWDDEPQAKVIVFSTFIPTLRYLKHQLKDDGIDTELLYGGIGRNRDRVIKIFETNSQVRILLSSEIGGEGLDLQFSSVIVNYDMPWNPMRLEQRIGRVDRLGQQRKKVQILNLIHEDTIDQRIYHRLYERLEIGRSALGDMEAILGNEIRELTNKLLNPSLTKEQQEEAINQTAQALENKRLEEEKLESDAGSLVKHGDYILNRIWESHEQRRFLTGEDIKVYIEDRLSIDYPGTTIVASPPGSDTYRITFCNQCESDLYQFLLQNGLDDQVRFLRTDLGKKFQFVSSVSPNDGAVEYISQLHPLVQFITERNQNDDSVRHAHVVASRISCQSLSDSGKPGLYVIAVRRWTLVNTSTNNRIGNTTMGYSGANVDTGQLIDPVLAEQMVYATMAQGKPMLNSSAHPKLNVATNLYREIVCGELDQKFEIYENQTSVEIEDRIDIRQRSLQRHLESKIKQQEEIKSNLEAQARQSDDAGDSVRARNLRNLARGRVAQIQQLRQTERFRSLDFEKERQMSPEESDVCCLFLQIESSN